LGFAGLHYLLYMLSDVHDIYRQPIPVNLGHNDLKTHLESAVSSTYLHLNAGTCTSIKFGTTGMTAVKLLENVQTALPEIIKSLAPTKRRRTEEGEEEEEDLWANIQCVMIKTSESTSLPIWSCQLGSGEGGRWDGLLAQPLEMEDDEEEHDEPPRTSTKRKAVKRSLAETPDTSKGNRKKRAAEESKEEPKRKRKKTPVGTDEVISEMKGLAIEKATPAKSGKGKTGGKTAETNTSAPALIKIKAPSLTSALSKSAPPPPESARKPKKKAGEEKVSEKAEVVLPSVRTTKSPAEIKSDQTKADKRTKAKSKTAPVAPVAPVGVPQEAGKDEKSKAEMKKQKKQKDVNGLHIPENVAMRRAPTSEPATRGGNMAPRTPISVPKLAGGLPPRPDHQAGENVKPLKSAIKSSLPSDGIKEKKRISFDLRSGKEGKGKKIGGKLSSKERLVGRGPRNA